LVVSAGAQYFVACPAKKVFKGFFYSFFSGTCTGAIVGDSTQRQTRAPRERAFGGERGDRERMEVAQRWQSGTEVAKRCSEVAQRWQSGAEVAWRWQKQCWRWHRD
jgi:hypothetical protein